MFYEKPSWVFNYSIRLVDYVRVPVAVLCVCECAPGAFTKIHKADRFLIIQGGWAVLYIFVLSIQMRIYSPKGNLYVSYIVKINKAINRLCGYYYYYLLDNKTPRGIIQKLNIIFSREYLSSLILTCEGATLMLPLLKAAIWFDFEFWKFFLLK